MNLLEEKLPNYECQLYMNAFYIWSNFESETLGLVAR